MANIPERTVVALFEGGRRDVPGRPRARSSRARGAGWSILILGLVGALMLAFVPAPYAIERPGPVFDTLSDVQIERDDEPVDVPLISIPGEKTYETSGTLSMLTVNVVGNRQSQPDWFEVVTAWGDPSKAVVPLNAIYAPDETPEQSDEQSAIEMQNSQKDAIAAALTELGYDLDSSLTVEAFSPDSPSDGVLEEGDQLLTVNGERPADVTQLRSIISDNGLDEPVTISVLRDGDERTLEVTPVANPDDDDAPIIGITASTEYDFPFEVKIQLDNVGGPSAGMMFALGIMDKLTPGPLNGGKDVAGTGTIGVDGSVGPIGGIRQKLYGARDAGADFFLAPASNCDEVVGHVPSGLTVFSVATLDDSLDALTALREGTDTSTLPSCGS